MILFARKLASNIEIIGQTSDKAGRYVIINFKWDDRQFTLCSLYAPNKDTPGFFTEIFNKLENYDGQRIIVGDFNCMREPEIPF